MVERAALHEAIRHAADPVALLDRIVRQSMVLVNAADGASMEMLRDAEHLEYISAAGTLEPFIGLTLPLHASMSGTAVLSGEVQYCADGLDDPRANREAVERTGVRSMLCVPLSSEGRSVAVLKISARKPNAFTTADAERLRVLARFLYATVSAASELANVTVQVLAELDHANGSAARLDAEVDTARFVANVMTPGLVDQVESVAEIQQVLRDEAVTIKLQPVVDLHTGCVVSCEALARFRDPASRSATWWFAAAHRVGLGAELEALAIRKALALLPSLPDDVLMAVNVGPQLSAQSDFAELFDGVALDRLTIELTEHDDVENYDALLAAMSPLRAGGARLSMDDTGSGYSGLRHLLRLRPDVIKLDRELVTGIHGDPAKRALALALLEFASSIESVVIAEGIEAQEEADTLRELGTPYGQGYLFARPMSLEELLAFCS